MTSDGVNTYAWDRADRLLSMGGGAYQYNGLGQRVQQTVGTDMTKYLLDVQPGLFQVLAETRNGQTTRHLFDPLAGLHGIQHPSGAWQYPLRDGLGSVKAISDAGGNTLHSSLYGPFGDPIATTGDPQTSYGFTGEPTDGTGLVYLRARYYAPGLGVFPNLDPLEINNRYQYVRSNPTTVTDPLGLWGTLVDPIKGGIGGSPIDPVWLLALLGALSVGGVAYIPQIHIQWPTITAHQLTVQEQIQRYFDQMKVLAYANIESALVNLQNSSCDWNPTSADCRSKEEVYRRALESLERLDNLRELAQTFAEGCEDVLKAVQDLTGAQTSTQTREKEAEKDNADQGCDYLVPLLPKTVAQAVGDVADIRATESDLNPETVLYYACRIDKENPPGADLLEIAPYNKYVHENKAYRVLGQNHHRFVAWRWRKQFTIPMEQKSAFEFGGHEWDEVTWRRGDVDPRWKGRRPVL